MDPLPDTGPSALREALLGAEAGGGVQKLVSALTNPTDMPGQILRAGLSDSAASAVVYDKVLAWTTMPEGAADRWGAEVESHRCDKETGCLLRLAQSCPQTLDTLRARLQAASEAESTARDLEANGVGRSKVPSLLAHREGTTTYSVAAEAVAKARAEQRAKNVAESPETAALAVRTELRDRGCCQAGERCFMQGFFGRSNNFMNYERKKDGASGTRDASTSCLRQRMSSDLCAGALETAGATCRWRPSSIRGHNGSQQRTRRRRQRYAESCGQCSCALH